ncbi:MAG: hypothetical protein IKQ88_05315 [Lachnospiraceae bacterium]|nr:hypothetical protein [Lachnospiraceae bacterium]
MKRKAKKLLSLLLCFTMVLQSLPVTSLSVRAEENAFDCKVIPARAGEVTSKEVDNGASIKFEASANTTDASVNTVKYTFREYTYEHGDDSEQSPNNPLTLPREGLSDMKAYFDYNFYDSVGRVITVHFEGEGSLELEELNDQEEAEKQYRVEEINPEDGYVFKGFILPQGVKYDSKTGILSVSNETKPVEITANFEEGYSLVVGGTEVDEDTTEGTGWSYDLETKTLTLNNFTYEGDGKENGIYYKDIEGSLLTIVLDGENTISGCDVGIISNIADVEITGEGDLAISDCREGIVADKGNITISGSGDLKISSQSPEDTYGISANNGGNLTINGKGVVEITGVCSGINANGGAFTFGGKESLKMTKVTQGIFSSTKAITFESEGKVEIASDQLSIVSGTGADISFNRGTVSASSVRDFSIRSGGKIIIATGAKLIAENTSKHMLAMFASVSLNNAIAGTGWNDEGNIGDIQKYLGPVNSEGPYYSYPYVKVQFPPAHKHNFTYKVSTGGDAIEASCNNTTDCDLEDNKVTLKIKQPKHAKYGDKKAAAATLEGKDEFEKATKATIGDIQYYRQIGEENNGAAVWSESLNAAPADVVGRYKAEIAVTVGDGTTSTTYKPAIVYTIVPDIISPSANKLSYTGTSQKLVSVSEGAAASLPEGFKFQYKLGDGGYTDSIPEAIAVGAYAVKYRVTSDSTVYGITLPSDVVIPDVEIKKAKLTVSANWEHTYDGNAVTNDTIADHVIISGYVGQDDATTVPVTIGDDYSIRCNNEGLVGEYEIVITDKNHFDHTNYVLDCQNGKLTIKEAVLSFSVPPEGAGDLVYDGTEQELVTAGTLETTGDVMYVLGRHDREAPKTGWSKDIPVGKDAKTYYVWYKGVVDGNDPNHKDSDPKCVTVTIAKAPVTVTIADKTRVYGDEDPELTATVTGMADGEELEYTLSREKGNTVGEYTISANYTATNNYEVEVKNGKFTIKPANVVVSVNAVSKNYGDKDPEFRADVTGLKSGDNESVIAYNISRIKGENIGEYQIIARGAETQENYNVTYIPANLTINPAPVVVKAEDKERLYGATDPELTWTATGLKNGDTKDILTVHIAREQGNAAGVYPIVVTGDKEQGNYSITFVDGKFTIMPADVTIIKPAANELTFDGEAHDLVTAGSVSEGKIQYAVSTNAASAPTDETLWSDKVPQRTDAGTYHVWYRVVDNPNFNHVDPDHVDVTIAKKAVTITADKATKIYGEKDPYFTAVVEGTVGEDTIEYTVSRVKTTQNAGVYTDDILPVVSGTYNNYEITCIAADYTIMQAEVTVTAANKTKVYGNVDPEFTWTVTGLKYSDTKSVITANPKRVANDDENVGDHRIIFEDAVSQDNYKVKFVDGTLKITPASVVITPVDKTKVYGDEDPKLEWTVTGLSNNETEEVIADNVSIVREEGEDAGEYSIFVSGAKTYGNYSFSYGRAAKLTITQKVVKVNSVRTVRKTYDGNKYITFSDNYATITDLNGGSLDDKLSVYVTAEYDDANSSYRVNDWDAPKTVSINSMILSGNKAANYSISVNASKKTTTGYIDRAKVTVSACSTSKEYGQVDPELKFTCEGLMDVDKNEDGSIKDGVFTGRLTRTAGEEVGDDYVILQGTLDSQNYKIDIFEEGTFKILVSTIDPSVSVQGWTYGGYNEEVNSPKVTGNFGNGVETYYYYPVADEGEDVPATDEMLEGTPAEFIGGVGVVGEDEEEVQGTEWDDKEVAKLPAGDYCVYARVSDKTASGNSTSYNAATTAPFRFTVSKKLIGVEWTDTTLTYNGTAQKPVATATGTVSNDVIQIEVSGEEINVGTYLAVASGITGERAGSYELLDDTTIFNIKKAVVTVSADALSKTYGEADPELTVSVNGVIGEDVIDYEVSREAGESAGRYNILVIAGENPNYDVKTTGAKLVINKAVAAVSVVPAAKILVYDGQAQELVEEGRTNDGIMYYAVTETNAAPASYAFKANVPTATEDGTYYVWYMVKGDADHSDMVAKESIEVKIEACAAVEKKPVAVRDLTESYEDQALIGEGTAFGGKMLYALGESADVAPETGWTTEVPKAKAPGIYYVWYYVEDEKGLKDTAAECVTVVVAVNEKIKAERAISSNLATIEDTVSIVPDAAGKVWMLDASANDASSNELTVKATFVVGAKITLAGYDKQATKQFKDFNKTSKKTATISNKGVLKAKKAGTGVLKYVMTGGRVVTLDYTVVKPAVTVEKGLNISVSANAPGDANKLNATYSGAGTYDVKITGVPLNSLYTFKGRTPLSKDNIVIGKDGEIHVTGVVAAKNSSKIVINAQGKKYTVKVVGKFK